MATLSSYVYKYVHVSCRLVDQAFSLANPSIKGQDVAQPDIFDGLLKSYQLKVPLIYPNFMVGKFCPWQNWLRMVRAYEGRKMSIVFRCHGKVLYSTKSVIS